MVTFVQNLAEERLGRIEFAAHIDGLRATAGEQKGDFAGAIGARVECELRVTCQTGSCLPLHKGLQLVAQFSRVGGHRRQAMRELGAPDLRGVGQVGQVNLWIFGQIVQITLGQRLQRGLPLRAQRHQMMARHAHFVQGRGLPSSSLECARNTPS